MKLIRQGNGLYLRNAFRIYAVVGKFKFHFSRLKCWGKNVTQVTESDKRIIYYKYIKYYPY